MLTHIFPITHTITYPKKFSATILFTPKPPTALNRRSLSPLLPQKEKRNARRSDARFFDACGFLIKRFRPGMEIASVFFLVRLSEEARARGGFPVFGCFDCFLKKLCFFGLAWFGCLASFTYVLVQIVYCIYRSLYINLHAWSLVFCCNYLVFSCFFHGWSDVKGYVANKWRAALALLRTACVCVCFLVGCGWAASPCQGLLIGPWFGTCIEPPKAFQTEETRWWWCVLWWLLPRDSCLWWASQISSELVSFRLPYGTISSIQRNVFIIRHHFYLFFMEWSCPCCISLKCGGLFRHYFVSQLHHCGFLQAMALPEPWWEV